MLAGVRAAPEDAEFILFLDDDIRVHRNTVGTLVESMQTHAPRMFLSNGFPFDRGGRSLRQLPHDGVPSRASGGVQPGRVDEERVGRHDSSRTIFMGTRTGAG